MSLGYPATARRPAPGRGFRPSAVVFERGSPLRRLDWWLQGAVLGLCGIGALLVWSATRDDEAATGGDPQAYLKRQLLNVGIGLVLGGATTLLDHRLLRIYAPVVYLASLAGLVAVLTPLGRTINGSHSWIVLGGLSIQPSEFAKVALVAGMAMLLTERAEDAGAPRDLDVVMALALAGVPTLLVLLQPDVGTVMVFFCIVFGLVALSGAPRRWVIGLLLAVVVGGVGVARLGLLEQHQIDRFAAFANPSLDPRGVGYNTTQARIAIGSGGVTGQGLFHGTQTSGDFVPEQQTDFVFTVAGEELGFLGSSVLLALLGLLLWRGCRVAWHAEDVFGTLVAGGVVCWFAFQVFENVGMTLGIMPVTGLPLPFVSYGGSAMFANFVAVGLLQAVHLRRWS